MFGPLDPEPLWPHCSANGSMAHFCRRLHSQPRRDVPIAHTERVTNQQWTNLRVPTWLYGGKPQGLFAEAGLEVRKDADGDLRIRTRESYIQASPRLMQSAHYYGMKSQDRLDDLRDARDRVEVNLNYARLQSRLDQLEVKAREAKGGVQLLEYIRGVLISTPSHQIVENARHAMNTLQATKWAGVAPDGSSGPFEGSGLSRIWASEELYMRLRLPSVMLRLEADTELAEGSTEHIQREANGLIFSSSQGLYDGTYTFDPYLGPLLGSCSPSIWGISAPRASGTLLLSLGRAVAGTAGEAAEMLQLLPVRSPSGSYPVPQHALEDQMAAIDWWTGQLNQLFALVGDPVLFSAADGVYNPHRQLSALLTVEQLFRRVTSLLAQHRDTAARQVLMFTCLDTLEGLTGRNLLKMFEVDQLGKAIARLERLLPSETLSVLLPGAERARSALQGVGNGFFMARQRGRSEVEWAGRKVSIEKASAHYLVALRNATHGHGGDRGTLEERQRSASLIAQHNGSLPDNLALVAYVYLLDFLADADRLRRIWSRPSRGSQARQEGPRS